MNAQEEKSFPKRTDKPFIGKADPTKYTEAKKSEIVISDYISFFN